MEESLKSVERKERNRGAIVSKGFRVSESVELYRPVTRHRSSIDAVSPSSINVPKNFFDIVYMFYYYCYIDMYILLNKFIEI